MARHPRPDGFPETLTTAYEVGAHTVHVSKVMEGRWVVAVDGVPQRDSHATQADAWEAGVREAARLDARSSR